MTPTRPHPDNATRGWHPLMLDAVLAAWLASAGNLPLWLAVLRLPETQGPGGWVAVAGLVLLLAGALLVSLGLLMWGPWRRALGLALIAMAGLASYFMLAYGIVVDPGMLANVFHTDALEVNGLLGWPLFAALLAGVLLPGTLWWRARARPMPWRRLLWQRGAFVAVSMALVAALLPLAFQDLASLMRNHKPLRYMVNPYNSVYALALQGASEGAHAAQPLQAVGLDAHAPAATDQAHAPLVVVVVGETVRAANFGLGGYVRDTTPRLRALAARGELTYFDRVTACGTSTQVSVPCMFSRLGRAGLDGPREENLLDVLQHAGLAVYWLDNQAGCKGVCERVPHRFASEFALADACPAGECPDAALAPLLPEVLSSLDAQRRANGSVVVLHQMGNHGPDYHLRSLPARKAFLPECETNALSRCDRDRIVNAYDNAVRETDHLLGELIAQLAATPRPVALLYVSDHGESLGENGLYLHGMPWSIAPDEQKQVPMLLWLSPAMRERLQLRGDCLDTLAHRPWSHDNLFHTVAGLVQVSTRAVDPGKDMLRGCRAGG